MSSQGSGSHLDVIAGAFAGAGNIGAGYPFDTVKVRLQAAHPGTYRGPFDCLRSLLKHEGVKGLYRGLTAPLIGGAAETGINYAVYTRTLAYLEGENPQPRLTSVAASAAAAGVVLSFVLSPAELVKCRMQMGLQGGGNHTYAGPIDCLRRLIHREGVMGLTRGLSGTLAREVPGNAVFFAFYQHLRRQFPGQPAELDRPRSYRLLDIVRDATSAIVCGGIAGMIMWAIVLPIDVAKTRIHIAHPGSQYDVHIFKAMRLLYKEGGARSMYAGLTPTLVRAFPANAMQWLVFDFSTGQFERFGLTGDPD